ncbi:triose-phosphate isomerase [Pseudomonas sp. Choline-3u-10]|jgi:triosephosphate isomerase (TIM)|uniref:triose-phosphate isomerase n=1 Tax=Pseudomonadaceae TaxID=135621 RepID=UPI000617D80F|nr:MULTISPECIES: triose-phosphate isomerase [Pseudomonadaceae]MAL36561.1 triose-phosphate isomerase [Pseudomonas sp.]MBU0948018.1 triose-phosphate isomerase [Gammaproteobacteria bacterium]KJJ63322.1 triosephosphate isomerase [Pseudomonas sp. 10B238]MBK3796247.1 triose-phosphate isomerase [Stutzerimonas stutzeri]MBK3876750.1 triose-phosphate isomerase [Stutzerimonas stutzeri]|tara:strand:- start:615 stop:1370 length:756 start_codon:yes stop_codon:yes gene_type:complete
MRRPLVAGNWKMNGTRASVAELIEALRQQGIPEMVEVVVFPTTLHLMQVVSGLEDMAIAVGAQDCAVDAGFGALTGEESASQLADAGSSWVLVGHSERRLILGESDEVVSKKFAAALACGMTPVLCLGETLEQRQAGQTLEVVERQLARILADAGVSAFEGAVVAYEPVWAIGTGLTATPQQAQEVHSAIREQLSREDQRIAEGVRLLYGGSVKAENAAELFGMPDIDGGLIGGASLKANDFGAICRAAGN